MNGDVDRVGEDSRLGSGSEGELGRLEPMVNLVPDFRPFLYLCLEAESGGGVLDGFVRSDDGCKNGGEKGGSPLGFWN